MVVERLDETIRYKKATFRDPDEAMLLPESIQLLPLTRASPKKLLPLNTSGLFT